MPRRASLEAKFHRMYKNMIEENLSKFGKNQGRRNQIRATGAMQNKRALLSLKRVFLRSKNLFNYYSIGKNIVSTEIVTLFKFFIQF